MGEIAQAAGSADAEMDIIRDSVAFKLNELKQTWIGYAQELLQRDDIGKIIDRLIEGSESLQTTIDALTPVVSTFIDLLSQLIDVLADLSEATNGWAIPAIAGGIGSFKLLDKVDTTAFDARINKVRERYNNIGNDIPDPFSNSSKNVSKFSRWGEGFEEFEDTTDKVEEGIENIGDALEKTGSNGDVILTALKDKLKQVGAILTSPTFWGIVGITAVVYALHKLYKAQGEIFEQAHKAQEEYKENEKALEDYKTQILDLRSITDDSTKSIEEQQSAREQLLDIQSQLIEQYGIEAGSIDILSNSIERLNFAFDGLSEKSYQEFLNSVNRNDGWNGWWHKLATGELFDSSISNASYIKDQMENAHSELFYDTGLTTKGQNQLVSILNEHGISTKYNEGSGIYGVDVDNLQNYYDTLIEIQTEYRDKQDAISASAYKAIEQEVNRVNDILTEISPVYNQMLEHDVINKNYKDEVEKIESLKQEIKKAQIADDKDAVESLTKQLYEAYNGVLEKAGSDESVKNWFGDFVSEVQTLLDSEEFRLKIYPEIETDESRDFQETKDIIAKSNNEHLFDDEVYSLVNSNASTREIGDKYGADVERVVGYIRRQLKAGVPIDLVIDELEIPNKTIRNLGKEFETAFNKLNEEDQSIILQFSEKEIKDEISVAKNEYRKMLNEFSKEGNVDLTIRPKIDSSTMQSAGWDVEDGSVSTTFKSGEFIWQGDEENGKYVYIHYTPILPDGTVLTPKEMDDYLYNVLEGSDDILGADSKGLVIKVDADVDIPEGEIDAFKNGGQISKGIKDFISKTDNWDNEVHKVEEAYYDVNNSTQFVDKAISNLIRKTKELAEETKEVSFEDTINSLSDLEGQIGNVDNAMSKFFDDEDGNVELSDIKAIQDAFAEIEGFNVDDVADDLNSLISAGNYDEAADSIDRLVSKYIEASGILDTVNNKNKDLIATQLNLMGVTNAQEIVEASLNERSALLAAENEYLAETGEDVAEATYEEIYQFINLQNASEQTEKYLAQVAIEKIAINDNKINTAADCQQLLNLANTAMASAEAISTVKEAQAAIASNSITRQDWGQSVLNKINNGTFDWGFSKNKIELDDVSVPMAKYEGGKATKSAKDASSKGSEASKETFDWIETKIQRLERDITNLGKTADATYKTWAERTVALGQEMEKVNEQISLQESAYNAYMAKAESVGLSAQYKKLVQSGALKIDEITDETLKEQINNYKEWYEKALDAKDKVDDLKQSLADLAKTKFDNISAQFDDLISDIDHGLKYVTAQLESVETVGKIAGKSFYDEQIKAEQQRVNDLTAELGQLQSALAEGLASGAIEYGSQMFNEMKKSIYSVEESILDANNAILKFEQNIKQVAKANFDDLLSQFDHAIGILTSKLDLTDNIISMIESSGHVISRKYYEALSEGEEQNIKNLKKKYDELNKVFEEAVSSGDISPYTDEWYDMRNSIEDVKSSIIDATSKLIEYKNALRQIDWDLFDRGQTRLEQLVSESQFLIDLYEKYPLFDKDTGDITDKGMATRGLLVQNYETYRQQAAQLADEIERLKNELKADPKNTTLIDRLRELEEQERSALLSSEAVKESLRDLLQNEINALIDALEKLINKYTEALNRQKD